MFQRMRCFLLAMVLVSSLQVCIAGRGPDLEYPLETYVENYATIDEYLVEMISSDDLRSNFALAKEKLAKERSKLSIKRSRSLEKAMELIMTLSKDLTDVNNCLGLIESIEANDRVLENGAGILAGGDDRLRRLDRIVEQVAYNYLAHCRYALGGKCGISFMMRSYDRINWLLLKKEPTDRDPEVNMAKVDELLQETGEGSLREALRLLASLRIVSNGKVCNEEGFMVVLKNLVAARQPNTVRGRRSEIDGAMRRIDRLVLHYATSYTDNCYDLFSKQFRTLIEQIDSDTSRNLRLLASELHIGYHEDTEVAKTQFQTEFTTPELVKHIISQPSATYTSGISIPAPGDDLRRYIRDTAEPSDPDVSYLGAIMVEGENCVDLAKIASLYDRYVVVPCLKYIDITGKFFERFRYNIYRCTRENSPLQSDQVSLGLGLGVYHLCDALVRAKQHKVHELADIARGTVKSTILINYDY